MIHLMKYLNKSIYLYEIFFFKKILDNFLLKRKKNQFRLETITQNIEYKLEKLIKFFIER